MAEVEWLEGGVTAVPGILAGGVAAGIKPSGKKDLALIYSSTPARAAAVFTSNQVKGAPVLISMDHARGGVVQAVLASSGCANVCTGEQGVRDAREITRLVGELLRIPAKHVLIAATGVIGVPLPMERIRAALPKLVKSLSPQGGRAAAEAILTTDTRPKEAALRVEVNGRPVTIGGVAKGVGMIEPSLATMLCFVATDAAVGHDALVAVTRREVERSFNRITIDGDQSTSDTVAVLANGVAENAPLERGSRGLRQLVGGLEALMAKLARLLVGDGEGATKLVTIAVRGAATRRDALTAARSVANSPLVKTAIAGGDANWGRIVMAVGKAGEPADRDRLSIAVGGVWMARGGSVVPDYDETPVVAHMRGQEIDITVDLGLGSGKVTVWTCDLTHGYIDINGSYRS